MSIKNESREDKRWVIEYKPSEVKNNIIESKEGTIPELAMFIAEGNVDTSMNILIYRAVGQSVRYSFFLRECTKYEDILVELFKASKYVKFNL